MALYGSLAARRDPAQGEAALPDDLILVGEYNPYGRSQEYALYPHPAHTAGGKLPRLLGIEPTTLECSWRANLCPQGWLAPEALARAQLLLEGPWSRYVLCGDRIRDAFLRAFGYVPTRTGPAVRLWEERDKRDKRFLAIPHPGGRAKHWREPGVEALVLTLFARLLEAPP